MHVKRFIFNLKLGQRIFLVYLIFGLLPMGAVCAKLISGTNHILIAQAQDAEKEGVEDMRSAFLQMQDSLTAVSRYFFFDEKLEKIASTDYKSYQEVSDAYRGYRAFVEYRMNYNDVIANIGIFMDNHTLSSNENFHVVDDAVAGAEWYQKAVSANGRVVWDFLPYLQEGKARNGFALARLLKTDRGEHVGVLAIYVRQEWLDGLLAGTENSFILLDGAHLVSSGGGEIAAEDILSFLPKEKETSVKQSRASFYGKDYIVTSIGITKSNTQSSVQLAGARPVEEILQDTNRQNAQSIALFAGSSLLMLLFIAVFAGYYGRRVERFRLQMQKAAEGDFKLEARIGGHDEISKLYDYLNTMIHKIMQLLSEIYQERIHAEQLKTQQKEAEFQMLTSQINPHFLYNTLETIRMKARVNRQYEIEEIVKMLAKLLSSSIQAGGKDVAIGAEAELAEYYLKIQQYRFGDRFDYRIYVEEGLENVQILPIILQPLAENALIHGLEEKVSGGHIDIRITKAPEEKEILFVVEDNGTGISAERLAQLRADLENRRLKSRHIGVSNVNQRIRLKYGGDYGLSLDSEEGAGTRVTLRIPFGDD